jgi:hypothetical protein
MRIQLNESDRKFIIYQMRPGKMIAAMVFSFGGFYNIFYFAIPDFQISDIYILTVDVVIVLLSIFIWNRINRKYRQDLEEDMKVVKKGKVQKKETYTSYETGSGSLYIPVLGDLFPKLFSIKMRSTGRYYLIINNTRMRMAEDVYQKAKVGDELDLYYTAVSDTRIGVM